MKKTRREKSVDKKIYTLIIENLNIELENIIVGSNNYTL